jgi:hypothetical protein
MFCSFTCDIIWNISEVSCEVVPLPWVASVILPGFAFGRIPAVM